MKQRFEDMSVDRPRTVEEVRDWLRRVELFEQVNWDVDMPSYGAVTHLLDDDFVWCWSSTCERQYEAVVQLTGVAHVAPWNRAEPPVEPPSHFTGGPSSPGTVGRPPSVLPASEDSEDESTSASDLADSGCSDPDGECDPEGGQGPPL